MKNISKFIVVGILVIICTLKLSAQKNITVTNDSIKRNHSYGKATLLSAIIPGLGQAYNKKYWKIPIIYTALGSLIFFHEYNKDKFLLYSKAYSYRDTPEPNPWYPQDRYAFIGGVIGGTKPEKTILENEKKKYKRNKDLCIIVMGAVYLLNVIDAVVDANMFYYDISDDLSLNIEPVIENIPIGNYVSSSNISDFGLNTTQFGIKCRILFK